MTIFDIKPYSFWCDLHRTAYHAWVHLGRDTPRSVCELYLLREVNRRLEDANRRLTTDLAETTARLSAEQRYRRREVTRQNERLTAANDLAERRGQLLREAMEENRYLMVRLVAAEPSETPQCNVFARASTNTPASGEACEIDGVACATEGVNNV